MIKVNLLKDQNARARKSFAKPTVTRSGLAFLAIAILIAAAMGGWTLYLQQQVRTSRDRQAKLRVEEQRLQTLKKEIDKFEKLKQQRQSRIDVIEKLKAGQTGPVLLLTKVIQSMPTNGLVWLTSLTQKADSVKIVGFTQQTEVIPDFISNLMTCGMFQSVDLENLESQKDASKFSLVCISSSGKKSEAE
jgi:type IV pilus assembly protein PilN